MSYDFTPVNLSALDLNLLLVLHAMLEERSVAKTARRLHVTPPAISNALSRLRDALGDPLFVRSGRGLAPTPRALELAPRLAHAMSELNLVVERAASDPAATTRELTIAMSDADQIAALPSLAAAFSRAMPRARLRVISIDALISGGGLEAGAADCAMGPVESVGANHSLHLFDEEGVLFARRGHALFKKKFTPELFGALRHVDIQLALGRGGVGNRSARDAFASAGFQRDIAMTVPSFAAAAMVVGSTDLIGGLPRRVAKQLGAAAGLREVKVPMPPLVFRMHVMWHARTDADPVAKRFREVIARALQVRP